MQKGNEVKKAPKAPKVVKGKSLNRVHSKSFAETQNKKSKWHSLMSLRIWSQIPLYCRSRTVFLSCNITFDAYGYNIKSWKKVILYGKKQLFSVIFEKMDESSLTIQ